MKQAEEDVKVGAYKQKHTGICITLNANNKHAFCVHKSISYFGNH
jgi:hypothetical protein